MQFLQGESFNFSTIRHFDNSTSNFSVNFFLHLKKELSIVQKVVFEEKRE